MSNRWSYYNDIDPFACDVIRSLIRRGMIPDGEVDSRSVSCVSPEDVIQFRRCHFFCGIAGWELALKLAGFPEDIPVWTGSCPCGPFSVAGKGRGNADPRDLWPSWFGLIGKCKPQLVFGEQVSAAIGHGWLDRLCSDMETEGYAVGSVVLGAHSVRFNHTRQRLYWGGSFANSAVHGLQGLQPKTESQVQKDWPPEALGSWDIAGNPFCNWREFLAESNVVRMDDGVSSTVDIRPRLHSYGNAIVPQVAAVFIRSFLESVTEMR